ncbi:hypothetical protein A3A71_01795 [Candidatus Berkelbacteria bacterium RIFCSPLOWO2_01_FULL_50_28]|uniref:Peptidase M50 domain-containing protein n=1 Tax=Candidatus Berkelbacteria bacterium RIFCSPLOWO2_01_FULL_50_28 TaxID=1797471 RepID=A0A1F5EBK2_9BACT|nr:MAG: hypothetical protein A3F39_01645 [Candidatus Berkelbacteria bacterium RIFCSPHIGHO2_12_FULL_50_11]OGD64765.1 MAG: hypothetical protein A3A71_01795 [Candidatus Berkelbacteria bacterium RIFCSPLOWO2_01_FULL_50_28]
MAIQGSSLLLTVVLIAIILISLSVHEFAHAFIANLFGDPTAKHEGRLTINPAAHWDPIGTTILVVLIALNTLGLATLPIFGWGKPVPINESNFENPRWHGLQTAIAGPMSNFIFALLLALVLKFTHLPDVGVGMLVIAISINLFLMFFNLLPIPPLDGSRILRLFMSERLYYALASNPLFLFAAIFLVIGFLGNYLLSATEYLTRLFLSI